MAAGRMEFPSRITRVRCFSYSSRNSFTVSANPKVSLQQEISTNVQAKHSKWTPQGGGVGGGFSLPKRAGNGSMAACRPWRHGIKMEND